MTIELTPEQQSVLDRPQLGPKRVIDPRTHTAYVLVLQNEYEAMRELLEDERREMALHAAGLRNAGNRLDEIP